MYTVTSYLFEGDSGHLLEINGSINNFEFLVIMVSRS